MLERLARFLLLHRVLTLVLSGGLLLAAVGLLIHGGRLTATDFPHTEGHQAQAAVEQVTGYADDLTFVVVASAKNDTQSASDVAQGLEAALAPLRHDPRVAHVVTPEEAPLAIRSRMVNDEARSRVALVTMRGTFAEALEIYPEVRSQIVAGDVQVLATGRLPFTHDLNETLESDLVRAELIALPLALLVLVLVFRSFVAATLPVGVGSMAVVGGIGIVFGLSHTTDVAMYTINVCSLIGLGVSIDYCLFIVSRYREELARGLAKDDAIVRAMATAGHTVAFSGLAVCTGLSGLFFFHGSYLFAMGLGGVVVVSLAVVFALTFLPVLLSLLGDRIQVKRRSRKSRRKDGAFWAEIARVVMKRPLAFGLPTLGLLLLLGAPFLKLRLAAADVRVLDDSVEARRGYEQLRQQMPSLASNRVLVAVRFPSTPTLTPERVSALYDLGERARNLPHVTAVETPFYVDGFDKQRIAATLADPPPWLRASVEEGQALTVGERVVTMYVLTDATPDSEEASSIVRSLREDRAVADGDLVVGGDTARNVDATSYIVERAPAAVGFVVIATLGLLFALLRSVLLPIKAVLMNFLSMAASFGALVWIFQLGHLGISEPRPLEPSLPVLLFCVLFGLSMDYEVLLLSRVREAYLRKKDNTEAVAEGLQKTAGLITSAAAIMIAVFVSFAFAHVVMIQAVGVGMALAVAIDATLVRTLLVPATMRLMGDLNWWAPSWTKFSRRRRRTHAAHPSHGAQRIEVSNDRLTVP